MAINGIAFVIDGVNDLTTSTSVFEDLGLHLVVITSIFYGGGLLTFSFRIADRMDQFISTAMVISIITALSLVRLKRRLCTGRWSRTQSLLEGGSHLPSCLQDCCEPLALPTIALTRGREECR
jgi:hypothetical protein